VSRIRICVHHLDDPAFQALGECEIVGITRTREDLRTLIGMERLSAVIVDMDEDDALDTVVEILELKQNMAVVGVTASRDAQKIIMAQRAGCRQLASKPIHPEDLRVALRRAVHPTNEFSNPLGKPIAVIGAVGGAGSTTIASYLALALADLADSPAAVLDLDLEFGSVARLWDVQAKCTIGEIAAAGSIDKLLLEDALIDVPGGVSVLARPSTIEQAHSISEAHVAKIIEIVRHQCGHVVMDLPRRLDAVTGAAIQVCKKLVVVTQLTANGIYNAGRLSDTLTKFGLPPDTIEFVVNRYRRGVHSLTVEALEARVGKKVLGIVPNNFRALLTAGDVGQPVSDKDPVRRSLAEIASRLTGMKACGAGSGWLSGLSFRRRKTQPVQ